MDIITQQQFDGLDIRFVNHPDQKYNFGMVADDLASVLDHSNSRMMTSAVREEWKGVSDLYTPGGTQALTVVWEPGVYQILATSRKPKAEPFQIWLYEEVLPSIRKTGSYSIKPRSRAQLLLEQAQMLVDLEERQKEQEEALMKQAIEAAVTKAIAEKAEVTALEAKAGLAEVKDQLASLKEFAVAQPSGLDQDLADQINQAFQLLGATLQSAGIYEKPKCYTAPWRDLGLTMRNSTINYDLNARYANADRTYQEELQQWKDNGSQRGQKPAKPTRISILLRDNMLTQAFTGAQQVIKDYLKRL